MLTAEQVEQAAQDYLIRTYQPLAACNVRAAESGPDWVVEAAIVRECAGKPTLEIYRLRMGTDLEPVACELTRSTPMSINYIRS